MKVVLIQPPIQDFYDTDVRLQPIGLCYLKAVAEKYLSNVQVIVKDYHHHHGRHTLPIPKELNFLKPYYETKDRSPFSTFHQYFHFGAKFTDIANEVAEMKPDLIGISSLFTPYYREVLTLCQHLKQKCNAPILLGGSHVSAAPEFMLAQDSVDYVIRGEGEKPFVQLLEHLNGQRSIEHVSNLGYKTSSGQQVLNAVGDNYGFAELPYADFSDLPLENYHIGGRPLAFLVSSRSCPHRCSFCSVHTTFGYNYRRNTVEEIFKEILTRYQQGYRVIDFEDDNLTFFKKDMKRLCQMLIDEFQDKEEKMEFLAMNGISYLSLDEDLLKLMKEAGFTQLNLSLVSSDQSVRESTKRPHTIAKYLEVVKTAKELGFKIVSYQILGLPTESLESIVQTLSFLSQQPTLIGVSPFYMIPNSPIAKEINGQKEPTELDYFLARLSVLTRESQYTDRDQIYTLFICSRIVNYLKSFPLENDISLEELLEQNAHLGPVQILKDFFDTQSWKISADNRASSVKQTRFQNNVFQLLKEKTPYISTLNNHKLWIN